MKRNEKILAGLILSSLFLGILYSQRDALVAYVDYSQQAVSNYGSKGSEVTEIQNRLKSWGYYKGSVDGSYGYDTYTAVRTFQSKNGLKVDGIAGEDTLAAIGINSKSGSSKSTPSTSKDANLLAHVIHGEARGEPYTGKVAIAAVILNRVVDSKFPKTIAGVVYQPGAFTAVDDGQINLSPDEESFKAAKDALAGWDPAYGALYYWNPATATSKWIWSRTITLKIGKHVFGV